MLSRYHFFPFPRFRSTRLVVCAVNVPDNVAINRYNTYITHGASRAWTASWLLGRLISAPKLARRRFLPSGTIHFLLVSTCAQAGTIRRYPVTSYACVTLFHCRNYTFCFHNLICEIATVIYTTILISLLTDLLTTDVVVPATRR